MKNIFDKQKPMKKEKVKESKQTSTKEIIIKIFVDCDKDEFGNIISTQGFEDGKEIQNTAEIIGWLQVIQQQEGNKLFKSVVEGNK